MSTPFAPEPEESSALSWRERAILAELERDLREDDSGGSDSTAAPDKPGPTGQTAASGQPGPTAASDKRGPTGNQSGAEPTTMTARSSIPLQRLLLLVPALVLVIVAAASLPASWSLVLAPLTLVAVVPWIAWCAVGRRPPR
jgi:hypothetical protein